MYPRDRVHDVVGYLLGARLRLAVHLRPLRLIGVGSSNFYQANSPSSVFASRQMFASPPHVFAGNSPRAPSGNSGRSTECSAPGRSREDLAGLEWPTAGRLLHDGQPIRTGRRTLADLPAALALPLALRPRKRRLRAQAPGGRPRGAPAAGRRVPPAGRASRAPAKHPHELSGGMQRRVAIAEHSTSARTSS